MTPTLDTLTFLDTLEKAQVPREQARAIVQVVSASHDAVDVATKGDLRETELRLRKDIDLLEQRTHGRFNMLHWMLGILIAGVMSLVLKAFA